MLSHREARLRRLFRCFDESAQREATRDPRIAWLLEEVARTANEKPILLFGNSLSHLAPLFVREFGSQLRLLLLYRHPVSLVASSYVMTDPAWWRSVPRWEDDPSGNKLTPFDPNIRLTAYRERWTEMGIFERILYNHLERLEMGFEVAERFPSVPAIRLRAEDLFDGDAGIRALIDLTGLRPHERIDMAGVPKNSVWRRTLEERPLGRAWMKYRHHGELLRLCHRLGYSSQHAEVAKLVQKYQRPPGIGPWLRHRIRYWQARRVLAEGVRRAGWFEAARRDPGVEPQH